LNSENVLRLAFRALEGVEGGGTVLFTILDLVAFLAEEGLTATAFSHA
jgi:hypothetical protein